MPVVMMPVVMMPVAEVADTPRAVIGPDDMAAAIRVIIGVIIIRVVGSIEEPPVMVPEREPAVVKASAENMRGSIPAAVEHRAAAKAAAMEDGAAA